MRISALFGTLFIGPLVIGQGFNERFDLSGNGFAQTGWGIERTSSGYCTIGISSDYDSVGVDSFFFHATIIHTFVTETGDFVDEVRNWRADGNAFPGWANCCDTVPGGGFIIGGSGEDSTGFSEVLLMRFNAEGDTLWSRVFGDPNGDKFWIGFQVKRAPNGDFLIAGITDQNGPFNGFVLRTDSMGDELWRTVYAYAPGVEGGLGPISLGANGEMFTSGTISLTSTNSDRWVQRLASDGSVRWQVSWGGPWREGATHVETLSDGHILVSGGRGYADDLSLVRPYLAKLDSTDGSLIWEHEYGMESYGTQFFPAKEIPNGDLIACGVAYYGGDQQGLLLRTTSEGDSIWMRSYYSQDTLLDDGNGRFYDVLPTEDGGFIAAGAAYFSASGNNPPGISQDTWVVKVDSMGCVVPGCDGVGVTEIITNMQGALTVFPSPAHGQVQVQIDLPITMRNKQDLQLSLMNATGQLVAQQAAFEGNNTISLSTFAAGLYHVHLTNGRTWLAGTKLVVE